MGGGVGALSHNNTLVPLKIGKVTKQGAYWEFLHEEPALLESMPIRRWQTEKTEGKSFCEKTSILTSEWLPESF